MTDVDLRLVAEDLASDAIGSVNAGLAEMRDTATSLDDVVPSLDESLASAADTAEGAGESLDAAAASAGGASDSMQSLAEAVTALDSDLKSGIITADEYGSAIGDIKQQAMDLRTGANFAVKDIGPLNFILGKSLPEAAGYALGSATRLEHSIAHMALRAIGVEGGVARLATGLLRFAGVGLPVVLAIGAVGLAWHLLNKEHEEAAKRLEELEKKYEKMHDAMFPGKEQLTDLNALNAALEENRAKIDTILARRQALTTVAGLLGHIPGIGFIAAEGFGAGAQGFSRHQEEGAQEAAIKEARARTALVAGAAKEEINKLNEQLAEQRIKLTGLSHGWTEVQIAVEVAVQKFRDAHREASEGAIVQVREAARAAEEEKARVKRLEDLASAMHKVNVAAAETATKLALAKDGITEASDPRYSDALLRLELGWKGITGAAADAAVAQKHANEQLERTLQNQINIERHKGGNAYTGGPAPDQSRGNTGLTGYYQPVAPTGSALSTVGIMASGGGSVGWEAGVNKGVAREMAEAYLGARRLDDALHLLRVHAAQSLLGAGGVKQSLSEAFKFDALAVAIEGFSSAIEQALQGMIAEGRFSAKEFAKGILAGIAQAAAGEAAMNFARGLAALAGAFLGLPNHGVAAATYFKAAAAFTVVAATFGAAASRISTGGPGGSGGASSPGGAGGTEPRQREATLIIEGGLLDMSDPRQADKFSRALEDITGQVVTVRRGA